MSSLGLVLLAGGSTNASERMIEHLGGIDPGNGRHSRPWPRDVDATAPGAEVGGKLKRREEDKETLAYSSLLLSSCTRIDQIPSFFICLASSGEASTSPISIPLFYPIAL